MGPVEEKNSLSASLDAALDGTLPRHGWPEALRLEFERRLDDNDYKEARDLAVMLAGFVVLSSLVEVALVPASAVGLLVVRAAAVIPLLVLARLVPRRLLSLQQGLLGFALLNFSMTLLHASLLASPPSDAFMALGVVTLIGMALPALPFRFRALVLYAVTYIAATGAALALGRADPQFTRAFFPMAVTASMVALGLSRRLAHLKQRNVLLAMQTEQRLADLSASVEQLDWLSRHDPLTGLPNRRQFDTQLARIVGQAAGATPMVAAMMADIDHFKAYNDRHGHLNGDSCIELVGKQLQAAAAAAGGVALRFGGEEYVLLAAVGSESEARTLAEDARRRAAVSSCTLSVGVALCAGDAPREIVRLLERADEALYSAKARGRDRVEIAA